MIITFENCETLEVKSENVKVTFTPATDTASSKSPFKTVEIQIREYEKIKDWKRLLHRDIALITLREDCNLYVPYKDEEEGILGSQNALECVSIDSNCLNITIANN